jgi:hypothetical protein
MLSRQIAEHAGFDDNQRVFHFLRVELVLVGLSPDHPFSNLNTV